MGPWKNYIPDQLKKEDPKMNIYQRIVLMKKIGIIITLGFLLATCTPKLMKLDLGMTKSQVISAIGKPTSVRGAMINKHGETVHVWEYEFWKGPTTACYWLYLVDDVLVQWGKAGDWQKESDRIYEIRFSNKEYLRR
jgi:hypothetical protein